MKTKSANLLAKGYELIEGITVPVGTSNIDLEEQLFSLTKPLSYKE